MSKFFYLGARIKNTNQWIGWMGSNGVKTVVFYGDEGSDPATTDGVVKLNWENSGGKNLLCADSRAYLGGKGNNGYYGAWNSGYDCMLKNNEMLDIENGNRILANFIYDRKNESSWEPGETSSTLVFEVRNA